MKIQGRIVQSAEDQACHNNADDALVTTETLIERVAKLQKRAAEAGFASTGSDIEANKAFMDDLSGNL